MDIESYTFDRESARRGSLRRRKAFGVDRWKKAVNECSIVVAARAMMRLMDCPLGDPNCEICNPLGGKSKGARQ